MNTWRILVSAAAALLVVLLYAVRFDAPPPQSLPSPDTTFRSACQEALTLAENGRFEEAITMGTKALRIGEKSLGQDRSVTPDVLDRWANTVERWYVAMN